MTTINIIKLFMIFSVPCPQPQTVLFVAIAMQSWRTACAYVL